MEIVISEKENNARYIAYVFTSLQPLLEACGAKSAFSFDGDRIFLKIAAEGKYETYLRRFAEEKIAEVIAVGYKYEYFRRTLSPAGLRGGEREILLAALILPTTSAMRLLGCAVRRYTRWTVFLLSAFPPSRKSGGAWRNACLPILRVKSSRLSWGTSCAKTRAGR